ncbi:hypothetical protein OIDMADRAFT_16215 [Oidiodendron maius Zn]|uniref:Uncharacterized protein n=1 Tax=Oidiodendron maius (strain Zn) TaxID=913774 RepID=A0A0C3HH85_OIDMZ|nr:hypothetical protein OIDMADRAFT_16215 [Oidiodendron maius Zn]
MYGLYKQEKVQGPRAHDVIHAGHSARTRHLVAGHATSRKNGGEMVIIQDWKYMADAYCSFNAAWRIGREKNDYLHAGLLYSPRACSVVGW